jgi:hypothetical protein
LGQAQHGVDAGCVDVPARGHQDEECGHLAPFWARLWQRVGRASRGGRADFVFLTTRIAMNCVIHGSRR